MTKKTKIIIPFLIGMLFLSLFGINVSAETNTVGEDNHSNCSSENHSHEAELTNNGLIGNITLPEKGIIGEKPEIGVNCSHTVTRKNCYGNFALRVTSSAYFSMYSWTAIECDVCGKYLRTEGYHLCYEDYLIGYLRLCPYGYKPPNPYAPY